MRGRRSSLKAPPNRRVIPGGGTTTARGSQRTTRTATRSQPRHWPGLKVTLFGVVLIVLGVLVGAALARELGATSPVASTTKPAVIPTPRPALTAIEESYSRALWLVHNEVKAAALRMTLGGIDYKTQEIDVVAFKERVEQSLAVYRRAEAQLQALQPPLSLQQYHTGYQRAVQLYVTSAVEMVKVAEDGQDQHLLDAFPLSKEAGQSIWEIGNTLWPGEYVPN